MRGRERNEPAFAVAFVGAAFSRELLLLVLLLSLKRQNGKIKIKGSRLKAAPTKSKADPSHSALRAFPSLTKGKGKPSRNP